ncbi:MAG: rhodanese-like domain-containing protein [Bacteriovorax sp.]|nr:rhodanese-like domain-containing protein [Bacteriovorax sp.]
MNFENYQSYILPIIIILFFAYRFYRFKVIKNKLPVLLKSGALLIDVRSVSEYTQGHNPQSINIPLDVLNKESLKLDKTKTIILCCASGTRSGIAVGILKKNGFKNVLNAGPWTNTLS